jgi:hypothetical protein
MKCRYCDKAACRLCDWPYMDADGKLSAENLDTCDRPLCLDHAKNHGTIFMCGKQGHIDSHDYCPQHDTESRHHSTSFRKPEAAP